MRYILENQIGSDCQVVAALNASIYLHQKQIVQPKSKEYDDILELTGCRYGSAISIERSFPILKIKEKARYKTFWDIDFTDLPLEIKTWSRPYGYHSMCAIDYVEDCEATRLLNFKYETTVNGWIFNEKLYYFINDGNSGWVARSFNKEK